MRCVAVQMAVVIAPVMLVSACMGGGGGGHSLNINDRSLNINDFERVSPEAFRSADAADSSADVAEGISASVQDVSLYKYGIGPGVRVNVKDGVDAPRCCPQGGIQPSDSEVTGRKWVIGNQSDHRANGGSFIRTFADYDENHYDYTDNWIAGGIWMRYTTVGGYSVSSVEAFVDGPEFRSAADLTGSSGEATYSGVVARGFYTFDHTADRSAFSVARNNGRDVQTGGYTGDFSATVDFDTSTVTGRVTDIVIDLPGGGQEGTIQLGIPATLELGQATINADGSFTGTAQLMYDGETIGGAGSWGNRFSSVDDGDGSPRAVIGTHSLSATSDGGARASFVGAHVGTTGDF